MDQGTAGTDALIDNVSDNVSETCGCKLSNWLTEIGKVLIVLDSYTNPLYITRIWTVYEAFIASGLSDVDIQIVMPECEVDSLLGEGDSDGLKAAMAIDAETAGAYCAVDEMRIKSKIRNTVGGFDLVNQTVQELLSRLLTSMISNVSMEAATRNGHDREQRATIAASASCREDISEIRITIGESEVGHALREGFVPRTLSKPVRGVTVPKRCSAKLSL